MLVVVTFTHEIIQILSSVMYFIVYATMLDVCENRVLLIA